MEQGMMAAVWKPVDVDEWLAASESEIDEPLGTKEKFWVTNPNDGSNYLFKKARVVDGSVRGEDWAEWAVHRLALITGLPTALTIPATSDGDRGILSRSVLAENEQLIHGNELLARVDSEYEKETHRRNARYTVAAVHHALEGVAPPHDAGLSIESAFDCWAGYALLDAWVAGRDRHHENWAAIKSTNPGLRLAPSYDHGNALGFSVNPDQELALGNNPQQLVAWCRRGKSHHFAGKPPLTEIARQALELASPHAREHWTTRFQTVSTDDVLEILTEIPTTHLSEPGRKFRLELLRHNQERIFNHG